MMVNVVVGFIVLIALISGLFALWVKFSQRRKERHAH